jgi:hypothetical protein
MKKLFQPAARLHVVLAVGAAIALAAGIDVASGAIPSSDGKINACQAKVNGFRYVRLLDTGESCRGGERPLSWSQKGPAGPPGPAGPKGSGLGKLTERTFVGLAGPGTKSFRSTCNAGEKVTGGAAFVPGDPAGVAVIGSSVDANLTAWQATVRNDTDQNENVVVQAICAA